MNLQKEGLEKERGMVDNAVSLHKFLCHESSNSNHGQTTVANFLGLHLQLTLFVLGIQSQWVKVQVPWEIGRIFAVGTVDLVNVNDRGSTQNDGPVPWADLV